MSEKFEGVPVESDTTILYEQEAMLGDYEVLYQKWIWEGVEAESMIFVTEDIAEFNEREIEEIVRESPMVKQESKVTIKISESGYCFVNFNFVTSE